MPPLSVSTTLSARSLSCTNSSSSLRASPALGARNVEVAAVEDEVLHHAEFLVEGVELRHDPQTGSDLASMRRSVQPEDL